MRQSPSPKKVLLLVAERSGPTMLARIGIVRALTGACFQMPIGSWASTHSRVLLFRHGPRPATSCLSPVRCFYLWSSMSSALASRRSGVSKPSVNHA